MKFSATVLATLASVSSARMSTGAVKHQESESYDARIIIGGLHHDATKGDLKTIGKSAVAAYNSVFSELGFAIGGIKTQSSIPANTMTWEDSAKLEHGDDYHDNDINCRFCDPDEDDSLSKKLAGHGDDYHDNDINCRFCDPDEDDRLASSSEVIFVGADWYHQGMRAALKTVNGVEAHQAFEHVFCANLRASGSPALVNAKDCSFSFMENPGSAMISAARSAYSHSAKGAETEAEVLMSSLKRDFSDADRKLINKSIVEAHREAFAGTGYSLKGFHTIGDVDIPSLTAGNKKTLEHGDDYHDNDINCRFCDPDEDDSFLAKLAKKLSHGDDYHDNDINCRFCDPDEDDAVAKKTVANKLAHGDDYHDNDINCRFCDPDEDDAVARTNTVTLVSGIALAAGPSKKVSNAMLTHGDDYHDNDINCRFCDPDEDDAVTKLEHGDDYHDNDINCRFCDPDEDDDFTAKSPSAKLEFLHEAFEKSFCAKLASSGGNFANVHGCAFRFVDTPAVDTARAAKARKNKKAAIATN